MDETTKGVEFDPGQTRSRTNGSPMTTAEMAEQLRALRIEIEAEARTSMDFALLMYDVCQALGLTEGECQAAVGPAWFVICEAPVDAVNSDCNSCV